MSELLYADETYKLIGAGMTVHRELGSGYLEAVYQEALGIELKNLGIEFEREKPLKILYKGVELEKTYFADFLCYGKIIVELKALRAIAPEHEAQVMNYLKCTG